jgi:hypothetical protein
MSPAALIGNDPRTHLPGRVVPDVLGMSTLQVGYPVTLVVLVKGDDPP